MTEAKKDTIYIDVDDEITSIVEKVQKSSSKIVALVLPKRAVVLQSIVNMKLLKRTADEASKRVVLITSETGLLPLAGAVGVYTAKNLQSKPEIPAAPESPELDDELLETEEASEEPDIDDSASVGELSGEDADDDVFESAAPAAAAAGVAVAASRKAKKGKAGKDAKAPKAPKDKKNKVPNFDRFRKRVVIGVLVGIGLLVACYFAFFVAPKAKITIQTETSTVNSSINFTASTTATTVDVAGKVVPAKEVTADKTDSQKAPATGQKDLGTKASGAVVMSIPCSSVSGAPPQIPAGTAVSTNGLNFITQSTVNLTTPSFSGGCKFSGEANVVAQSNGDQYNVSSGRSFTVAGFSSVTATNPSAMSGGVSKIAKVVSQQDVDTAKQKITDSSQQVKSDLQKQLEDQGYYALLDSFKTKTETITASPQVDQEGTEVTVTAARTYSMIGVKRDDLHALIVDSVKSDTEDRKQQVQDDGIVNAVFRINDSKDPTSTPITMQVPVVLGPKIDTEALKKQVAGKKKGDIDSIIKSIDGVKEVTVQYSPFWVSTTPKNTDKITIVYEEAKD